MCLSGDAIRETEEMHAMRIPSTRRRRLLSRRSALATCLLGTTFSIFASAAAAQLAPTSPAPTAVKAYVGVFKDDAVAVIDTSSNRLIHTIPVSKGPHGLVVTPDGRKVYVSSDGASTVAA